MKKMFMMIATLLTFSTLLIGAEYTDANGEAIYSDGLGNYVYESGVVYEDDIYTVDNVKLEDTPIDGDLLEDINSSEEE